VTDWPAWATEKVQLQPADPGWAERGARTAADLDAALAAWLTGPVEHVGSTAVPGLTAKPVLDFQAPVRDLADADAVAQVLAPAGWHLVPEELEDHDDERLLIQAVGDHRVAHLHLMSPGAPAWSERLTFRDALRGEPSLAEAYGALKQDLAARLADDREAYTDAKTAFVRDVLSRAGTGQAPPSARPA
jgi:GrpB-like predicted nucleotidyltransferase (UPF0157 family)